MTKPVGRPVTRPCGTVPAYKRHKRRGEDACDECKAAWAAWQRDYYARKRGLA
jgi:hypothetical protein